MTSRILRSESVVKLANKLLRTYSPGRLSGSTLMDIMVPGPFSLWRWYTGATGGLLYPGEAVKDNTHVCELTNIWLGMWQVQTKYIRQYCEASSFWFLLKWHNNPCASQGEKKKHRIFPKASMSDVKSFPMFFAFLTNTAESTGRSYLSTDKRM